MKFSNRYPLFLILTLFSLSVLASDVRIIKAELESYSGKWTLRVTLKHEDKGWKHYADGWRIVDEKGKLIATRTLHHPHDQEQPLPAIYRGSTFLRAPQLFLLKRMIRYMVGALIGCALI